MLQRLLCAFVLLFAATPALAQDPPNDQAPPRLDSPDHWEIHKPSGKTDLVLRAIYIGDNLSEDIYWFEITGTIDGVPFESEGFAFDPWEGDGTQLRVWNSDSGLWCRWQWEGDHYEKYGGTANRRSFHPANG